MTSPADYFSSKVDYVEIPSVQSSNYVHHQIDTDTIHEGDILAQKAGRRVCDRCIVKKVKCDMKHPTCSRCLESDTPCVYSVKKRKPGPVKGSKHAKRRTSKDTAHRSSVSEHSSPGSVRGPNVRGSQVNPWHFEQSLQQNCLPTTPALTPLLDAQASNMLSQHTSTAPPSIPSPLGIPPSLDQQRILLENFFLHIHPSIPLFHKERFFLRYDNGSLCPNLLLTICVVAAKILGLGGSWDGSSLEDCTEYLLELKVIEHESMSKPPSLDNFRQACILAFYAFHQYPGERSWMRLGQLTRKAYQCGLHQIDFHATGSQFNWENSSSEDLEEWRYVWWCIYCLDCYSNVTAVTPFVIEAESIKTALVTTSLTSSRTQASVSRPARYLPDDTDMLWKTVKEVSGSAGEINFNMHILTTTLIREAATIHRLRKQSTSKKLKTRLIDLESHFSSFRLALPARYLNPSRNAFDNESSSEHHARLICVLHIHLARILTFFPYNPEDNENDWYTRWQQCLESSEDIVSVSKQWDSQYFTATDPAICFLISFAGTMLHLHSCAANMSLEFKVRMDTQKDVLVLFLEQFASAWSLPKFLIMSFEQFKKMIVGPLNPIELDRILKVAIGPINYRWLNFLSLSADFNRLDSPGRLYENLFTQEWDSNEWEALMPAAPT